MRSGKRFHAIRDHVLHDDLMLAGLWGGQASKGIRMREMIATYFNGKQTNKYGHDQIFLGQVVWPRIKQQIFVHDKYYWTPGVKSHAHGLDFSFGEGHIDAEAVRMEAAALGLI
jgi:hypothetical protein